MKRAVTRSLVLALALIGGAIPAIASDAGPKVEPAVVTQHQVTLGGRTLSYTAAAGRLPVRDPLSGEPHAWMFYVAYRIVGDTPRPISFVFPGGPGSSGLYMHMAYGPYRAADGRMEANPNSLLGVTDLVFIDPVGSGFSRIAAAGTPDEFNNTRGDAAADAEAIRTWLARNDRAQSPVFVIGQSYGVWRAAQSTELVEKAGRPVAGAVMISGGVQVGPDVTAPEVLRGLLVPHHAAIAFHFGRLPKAAGGDEATVMRNAEAWARATYIPALRRIGTLSAAQREKVATELAYWTGLPATAIDRKTLAYTPNQFRTGLVPGKVLQRYDMRHTEDEVDADRAANAAAGVEYLRGELGYATDLAYNGEEAGYRQAVDAQGRKAIGPDWNYNSGKITPAALARLKGGGGPPGAEPWIPQAIALNPKVRMFIAAGRYDSLNSCTTNDDLYRRMDKDLAAHIALHCYAGGHNIQQDPMTAPALAQDIRRFITATVTQ